MGNFSNLLGAATVMPALQPIVKNVVTVFYVLYAALIIGYILFVAYKLATADNDNARKEAKEMLIYACVGLIVVVGLITAARVIPMATRPGGDAGDAKGFIDEIMAALDIIKNVLGAVVGAIALWIGYKFVSAEDKNKRQNAKMQLVYAIVAIIAVTVLTPLANEAISRAAGTIGLLPTRF